MSRSSERSINKLLGIEGGYSNHLQDTGGETRFGITEEVAKEHGYEGDMKELPLAIAREIYEKNYWKKNNLDSIAPLNEQIAFKVFECAVHSGSETSVKFLQRALNAFNQNEDIYDDLEVDGILGDKTQEAFKKYHQHRGSGGIEVLSKALNGLQASFYVRLCENNPDYETFVYGWINKRIN